MSLNENNNSVTNQETLVYQSSYCDWIQKMGVDIHGNHREKLIFHDQDCQLSIIKHITIPLRNQPGIAIMFNIFHEKKMLRGFWEMRDDKSEKYNVGPVTANISNSQASFVFHNNHTNGTPYAPEDCARNNIDVYGLDLTSYYGFAAGVCKWLITKPNVWAVKSDFRRR